MCLFCFSPFKAVWDWVVLILVLYTAVFTPYQTAFLLNEDETTMRLNIDAATRSHAPDDVTRADPLVIIDLIVDLMFIADILINFRTSYLHNGEAVMDQKKIAINYMKSWFAIDCIAAIPFDLLLFGSGTSDVSISDDDVIKLKINTYFLLTLNNWFTYLRYMSEQGHTHPRYPGYS